MSLGVKTRKGHDYLVFTGGRGNELHLGPANDITKINSKRVLVALKYVKQRYGHYTELENQLVGLLQEPLKENYLSTRLKELDDYAEKLISSLSEDGKKKYLSMRAAELQTRLRLPTSEVEKIIPPSSDTAVLTHGNLKYIPVDPDLVKKWTRIENGIEKFVPPEDAGIIARTRDGGTFWVVKETKKQHSKKSTKQFRVLLIEKNASISKMLTTFLRMKYYGCVIVDNVNEAVTQIQKEKFDLILTNPEITNMKSLSEFVRVAKIKDQKVVLLVNPNISETMRSEFLKMGVDSLLTSARDISESLVKEIKQITK